MELVLLIYNQLNSCVFLLMKEVFFCYILKGTLFCQNHKEKLDLLNYNHLSFHVLLLLKVIGWLLYYIICGEGRSNICCFLFIKATSSSCIFCFVVLGSTKIGVNKLKVFCFIKDSHQVHTNITTMLFFTSCVVLLHINEFELDGASFVNMKEKTTNSPLLVIDYDDFVAKCGVECEIIIALTEERKTIEEIQVAQAHQQ